MNKYGRQAQEAWKEASPTRYSEIQNPEEFFTNLGEQAQERMDVIWPQIAGPDPKGEGYLEKVGRLNASRNQAEEMVGEELLSPPEIEDEDDYVSPSIKEHLRFMAEMQQLREEM
ncbi:TnpV protein [Pseudarthrobacter sp. PS3-L1]|uniref:TnpV protein n=1 Tax=Pseudarthrobacter sp. PS3-L1 TaxID=3046207 RepID=UPI0024B9D374|nr:TnpV protein [Pseudarthrobacter sp. PS3-L1]MDJ0321958.1 TnpV protein [Pseudarthrobacter sp. PS3-L1]